MNSVQKTNLVFNNTFVNLLPADPITETYSRQVEHCAYSVAMPEQVCAPKTLIVSGDVANIIGLKEIYVNSQAFANVFAGNELLEGMEPYAMCYGGYQFGQWAGQLGDGRAINLGEVETPSNGLKTLQLKGAGPTPYSRTADGLAVLRSSVREFLCSEAMYHLGIPTTRALSLCLTGEHVVRDMMYDGNAKAELGAVVCRVSSSFMRFGSFQLPAKRRDLPLLTQMVDYCIKQDFPELLVNGSDINKSVYIAWFLEVAERTSNLIIDWMRVGFVHGVMNTDNLSIIGETIDFGPYGWIDNFDLDWTPNTTDKHHKRYRFGQQGNIALWNLCQLANAIIPLIGSTEELQTELDGFSDVFEIKWHHMMASKLGITANKNSKSEEYQQDEELFKTLENVLSEIETDMTMFYRLLASFDLSTSSMSNEVIIDHFSTCFYDDSQITNDYIKSLILWITQYNRRFELEKQTNDQRKISMNKVNPKYVLRNYLSQQAIDKAEAGDYSEIHILHELLKNPYDEQPELTRYFCKRPEWAKVKAGCSMLSCSS